MKRRIRIALLITHAMVTLYLGWLVVDGGFLRSDMERDVDHYRQRAESLSSLVLDLQTRSLKDIAARAADSSFAKSDTSFIYGIVEVTTNRDTTRIVHVDDQKR